MRVSPESVRICPAGVSLSKRLFYNCSFAVLTMGGQAEGELSLSGSLKCHIIVPHSFIMFIMSNRHILLLSQGLAIIN